MKVLDFLAGFVIGLVVLGIFSGMGLLCLQHLPATPSDWLIEAVFMAVGAILGIWMAKTILEIDLITFLTASHATPRLDNLRHDLKAGQAEITPAIFAAEVAESRFAECRILGAALPVTETEIAQVNVTVEPNGDSVSLSFGKSWKITFIQPRGIIKAKTFFKIVHFDRILVEFRGETGEFKWNSRNALRFYPESSRLQNSLGKKRNAHQAGLVLLLE